MASAAIGAGASVLSGLLSGKGAKAAAKAQAKQQKAALAQQQQQFAQTQANEAPFLGLGTSAVDPLKTLFGLNGNDAQRQAIAALQASPMFTSQDAAGQDALLQSAAATGGLRGGNVQGALYNQRASLLSSVIQNQLSGLGGLASLGANTASGLGQLGQANSNAQTGIYGNIGNANATRAIAPYSAASGVLNSFSSMFGPGGSAGNIFGGGSIAGTSGGIW